MSATRSLAHTGAWAIFLALFTAFVPGQSFAGDAGAIVSRLQESYGNISTVTADFVQEASAGPTGMKSVSEGKVYLKKPGKMKWVYSRPGKDELISDGSTLWFFQPDLNQAIERPVDEGATGMGTDFLSGIGSIEKDFDVRLEKGSSGAHALAMTPKNPRPNIKRLKVEIDRESLLVVRTVVEDHYGNETSVSFKNVRINKEIKDAFFEFKAPKGVTIVRP